MSATRPLRTAPTAEIRSADLTRLGRVLEVCARPHDFPTPDAWRADLLERVMRMHDAPMGHCELPGLDLSQTDLAIGYPSGVFELWANNWRSTDPTYELLGRLKLNVYTRRHRHRLAGPEWTRRYRRSGVFVEFYRRFGLVDGAGILLSGDAARAHLHVDAEGPRGDLMDERGRALLTAVEPVFRAAVESLTRPTGGHVSAMAVLDAAAIPAALLDAAGRWIHRTPAFATELDSIAPTQRAALHEALSQLACDSIANAGRPAATALERRAPELTLHGLTVSAVVVGSDALLRIRPRRRQSDQRALSQASLTRREVEVAVLIAAGRSSKQIAAELEISWHTVRRHTENILKKLEVDSRAELAALFAVGSG